ncbi:MAG: MATE family efflux transporter [Tolumonas sp.]|nr:MAG: MATE family efflux transporter [Tolumonas sp.]
MVQYRQEIRRLIGLAFPILLAQVAQTAMTLVDTIMAGRYSAIDLAAISVASSFWLPIVLTSQGIIMALTPIVAQLNGAQKKAQIPHAVAQGLWLTALVFIPAGLLLYFSPLLLHWMDVSVLMAEKTTKYLHAMLLGLPAYLYYQVLRNYAEGLSHTIPGMCIGFAGLLLNIPLNYLLIYGVWGFPELGGVGCGFASAAAMWFMAISMTVYVLKSNSYAECRLFRQFIVWNKNDMLRIFKLGAPIALALFCEVTLFTVVALLLAPLGPEIVASHQVALNYSSLIFMLPLSLGYAVTIRVGHTMGEKLPQQARIAVFSGLMVGLSTTVITATVTILFRHWIAMQYTDEPSVIALAAHLIIFAAVYQFSDTVQAVASGALRGFKDTKIIFLITLFSYWMIGIPTGIVLGLTDWISSRMGPQGFWIGIIIGLTTAATLLALRLKKTLRRTLTPLSP